ncbi:MAG: aminoacyl-tRNA deacylase [Steroidobacteraceae bacterium]
MKIAPSVQEHLSREAVGYELIEHQRTLDSAHTAEAAHVPGAQLAKGTVLKDENGFLIAIVPATRRVDLGAMHRRFRRPLGLATESELATLFADCEPGAIPPLGAAYGIDCVLDDSLMDVSDVYFEAGDHCGLVHVSGTDFQKLVRDAAHGAISQEAR